MADATTPVSIGKPVPGGADLGRTLGQSAADVIRLHMGVIDREDRLESGTGTWLADFLASDTVRSGAVRESVRRTLHTATDATNLVILENLSQGIGTPVEDIEKAVGLTRLPLAERIGDLVSAGLATKIPEANQIAGTAAGVAIVELLASAGIQGAKDLTRGKR